MKSKSINSFAIFILLLNALALINADDDIIIIEHLEDSTTKITFKPRKNYLLLPIQESQDEAQVIADIKIDVDPLKIRLARTSIDYYVPLDLKKYKDTDEIIVKYLDEKAITWENLKLSDTFNTTNREEKWRPLFHFSPPYGWMNDPNGMFYKDGEYHLYYQYNPYGSMWGNMHWGHAKSKDLFNWEYLPIALYPDEVGTAFSGSCIVDTKNKYGMSSNTIIAFYTADKDKQRTMMAYSTDNGLTFTRPSNQEIVYSDLKDFRDPKVINFKDKYYVIVIAAGNRVNFFTTEDFKSYKWGSAFGENEGEHGGVWECPDLFELKYKDEEKWILIVNINPGGPYGGSATQYFVGEFNGTHFSGTSTSKWLDYGKDHYAAVTWANLPDENLFERRIGIAWMSNWQYAQVVPTIQYRSAMSIPRELILDKIGNEFILRNRPIKEVEKLRKESNKISSIKVTDNSNYFIEKLLNKNNGAFEIEFNFNKDVKKFIITLSNSENEYIQVTIDNNLKALYFNREKTGKSDFSNDFPCEIKVDITGYNLAQFRLILDKSNAELFLNDGMLSITNIIFPSSPYNSLKFISVEGDLEISNFAVYSYTVKSSKSSYLCITLINFILLAFLLI